MSFNFNSNVSLSQNQIQELPQHKQQEFISLEKTIPSLYTSPTQSNEITSFIEQVKSSFITDPNSIVYLFQYLSMTKVAQFQFWILDQIINLTQITYPKCSNEIKINIRSIISSLIQNSLSSFSSIQYISGKFCQCIITWLKYDYPENFQDFFKNILKQIIEENNNECKIMRISFMLDLLSTFDDELIKFRHTYTEFEAQKATAIKDYMRINTINDIVFILNQVISNESFIEAKIVIKSMKVVSQLIDWNVLNVFNDILIVIFNSLISKQQFQLSSFEIINALVKKGMDINIKLDLIRNLNIQQIIQTILLNNNTKYIDISLCDTICEIINNLGISSLWGLGYNINSKDKSINHLLNANNGNVLAESCDLLVFCLDIISNYLLKYHKSSLLYLEFLQNTNHLLKNIQNVQPQPLLFYKTFTNGTNFGNIICSFLTSLQNSLCIPSSIYKEFQSPTFNIDDHIDDDFFQFRKDFSVIYYNMFSINNLKLIILDSIISLSQNQNKTIYTCEHFLFILNSLINNILKDDFANASIQQKLNSILPILFTDEYLNYNSGVILYLYYDTITKYLLLYIDNQSALDFIINNFLSQKGIVFNTNFAVASKIAGLFDKFIERVKSKLPQNKIEYIIKTLSEYSVMIIQSENFVLIKQYEVLYKTIGQVIKCSHDLTIKVTHIQNILQNILNIFNQYNNFDKGKVFESATGCLTSLLTVFPNEINEPQIKSLFINFFNVYINEYYNKLPPNCKFNTSIINLIQRIIIILNKDSLIYLDNFIQNQIATINQDNFNEICKVYTNTINSLKDASTDLIKKYYITFLSFVRNNISIPLTNISETDKNILSIYASYARLFNSIMNTSAINLFINGDLVNTINIETLIKYALYLYDNLFDGAVKKILIKTLSVICLYFVNNKYDNLLLNVKNEIMNGLLSGYKKLNLSESNDYGCVYEMVKVFSVYVNYQGGNCFYEYVKALGGDDNYIKGLLQVIMNVNFKVTKLSDETMNGMNYLVGLYNMKNGIS